MNKMKTYIHSTLVIITNRSHFTFVFHNQNYTHDIVLNLIIRDRPIYRPGWYNQPIFGFWRYIGIGQNGRFCQPQ